MRSPVQLHPISSEDIRRRLILNNCVSHTANTVWRMSHGRKDGSLFFRTSHSVSDARGQLNEIELHTTMSLNLFRLSAIGKICRELFQKTWIFIDNKNGPIGLLLKSGGGGEIRTHGRVSPSLVFKTSALNHSATPPQICPLRWF